MKTIADYHYWWGFWACINCLITGIYIGIGFGDYDVSDGIWMIILFWVVWFSVFCYGRYGKNYRELQLFGSGMRE